MKRVLTLLLVLLALAAGLFGAGGLAQLRSGDGGAGALAAALLGTIICLGLIAVILRMHWQALGARLNHRRKDGKDPASPD